MDTYILRIYRRSATALGTVHGTLERVGVQERASFASRDELWGLLVAPAQPDDSSSEPPGTDESNL
jgi:hypothetical protein